MALHYISLHCIALHYISLLFIAMHCIALHCLALHCITLHSIALHCIPLHCIAVHCIALHCIALHYIALHCIALQYIAWHYIALHFIALHYIALQCSTLHCTTLHCIALHYIAFHYIALHCSTLHCITLHCIALHCIAVQCIELQAFIYSFFRSIYDFFRVHFVFHVGVSGSNSFGFLSVSQFHLRCLNFHLRYEQERIKTKKVGFQFHVGILLIFTSLKGFISSFFCVSVGFHVGFHLGILSDFLSRLISSVMWISYQKILSRFSNIHVGFLRVSLEFHFRFRSWGVKKTRGKSNKQGGGSKKTTPSYTFIKYHAPVRRNHAPVRRNISCIIIGPKILCIYIYISNYHTVT